MYVSTDGKIYQNHSEIRSQFRHISLPKSLGQNALEFLGLVEIQEPEKPTYDPTSQKATIAVQKVNDEWVPGWVIVDRTAADTAIKTQEKAQQEKVSDYKDEITQKYGWLNANKEAISDHIENNVTNLAEAKAVLKVLANVCALLASPIFEEGNV